MGLKELKLSSWFSLRICTNYPFFFFSILAPYLELSLDQDIYPPHGTIPLGGFFALNFRNRMTYVTKKGSCTSATVTTECQWLTPNKDFEHKTLDSKWSHIKENIRLLKLSIAHTFQCNVQHLNKPWWTLTVSFGCSLHQFWLNILSSLLFGYLLQLPSSLVSSGNNHLPKLNSPNWHNSAHHRANRIFADIVLRVHQYLLFLFLPLYSSCLVGFVRSLGLGLIFVL